MFFAQNGAIPGPTDWTAIGILGFMAASLLTLFGWFVRHLLTETFPTMLRTFAEQLSQIEARRATMHADNRADHKEQALALMELARQIERLIAHLNGQK